MTKMMRPKLVLSMLVFACGFCLGNMLQPWSAVHAQPTMRVFEIRTYTAAEGKLDALHARFRDHTLALFKKHGMTSVGYFKPQDAPFKQNTLIYILAHPSREAAAKNWRSEEHTSELQSRPHLVCRLLLEKKKKKKKKSISSINKQLQ